MSVFRVGLGSLLRQAISEPEFCSGLVCKLKKIVGPDFFQRGSLRWFPIVERLSVALMYYNGLPVWCSARSRLAALLNSWLHADGSGVGLCDGSDLRTWLLMRW